MTTKDILAIQVSTVSSGSLISWNGSSFTSIPSANVGTSYTAGTGLDLSGSQFSIDDSVTATISGSTFTGAVKFNQGLSGSLTQLTDGSSYLIEGSNITISSSSNGAVTISSPIEIFKVGKTIDENKTGNTVSSDAELTISFSEVGLYALDSEIHFTANLGVGIKYRYYLTSGVGDVTWHSAFNPPFALISSTSTNSINGAGAKRGIFTKGFIEVTAAPAVLYFQWSQDSTDLLNPTTVHKGSWILVTKTV